MSHAHGLRELLQEPMLSWRCHQLSSFGMCKSPEMEESVFKDQKEQESWVLEVRW